MYDETALEKYFGLMKTHPKEFENSGTLHIVKEEKIIREYIRQTGKKIGILFDFIFVVWLEKKNKIKYFVCYAS